MLIPWHALACVIDLTSMATSYALVSMKRWLLSGFLARNISTEGHVWRRNLEFVFGSMHGFPTALRLSPVP